MNDLDQPGTPSGTRRPWDEVLADFAARAGCLCGCPNGRPLWDDNKSIRQGHRHLWAHGHTCEQICRQLKVSEDTAYRYREAS